MHSSGLRLRLITCYNKPTLHNKDTSMCKPHHLHPNKRLLELLYRLCLALLEPGPTLVTWPRVKPSQSQNWKMAITLGKGSTESRSEMGPTWPDHGHHQLQLAMTGWKCKHACHGSGRLQLIMGNSTSLDLSMASQSFWG